MSDCEKRTYWQEGMMDAAQILTIYPEGADYEKRLLLDKKRREIWRAAGIDIAETKPANRQRLGDGVTAEMLGSTLRLSVTNGDGRESVILMERDTCDGFVRYIHAHVRV